MNEQINNEIVLVSRPRGMPEASNFQMKKSTLPEVGPNDVLVRALYLSVDPYMRGRLNDRPSYIPPFSLHEAPEGGGIGRVVKSNHPNFKANDIVYSFLKWADYSVVDGEQCRTLQKDDFSINTALSVLGLPGMTAYFGLLDIGMPKAGETVVISAAAGAVGSLVGQIAKIKGCKVVGIAGGDTKTHWLTHELSFDAAIDYREPDWFGQLRAACSNGVDIYFDNVGGDISDAVMRLINQNARIVLCGQISGYNLDTRDVGPRNQWLLIAKSALMKGFIVGEYEQRFPEALEQLKQWLSEGKIRYKETIVEGLVNLPQAFLGLFKGNNIGKQLVKIPD